MWCKTLHSNLFPRITKNQLNHVFDNQFNTNEYYRRTNERDERKKNKQSHTTTID